MSPKEAGTAARTRRPLRPTLAMIAKASGYSVSTVSAILNQRPDCWASPTTRQQVEEVARRLGYRPNLVAQSLRGGQTWTLGLLTAALNVEIATARVQAFETIARDAGYTTMMVFSPNDEPQVEDQLIERLLDRSVDGLAVYPTETGRHQTLRRALELGVPVVTIDGAGRAELDCDDVSMDYRASGRLQAEHLIACGYRRLVQINTTPSCYTKDELRRGFVQAVHAAGLPPPQLWDCEQPRGVGSILQEDLCQHLSAQLRKHRHAIDAIASYDIVAAGAMRAAYRLGIRVPDELAIIGSDGSPTASNCVIPLTTIAQPVTDMGVALFRLLHQRIAQRQAPPAGAPPQRLRLAPQLVLGSSTVSPTSTVRISP